MSQRDMFSPVVSPSAAVLGKLQDTLLCGVAIWMHVKQLASAAHLHQLPNIATTCLVSHTGLAIAQVQPPAGSSVTRAALGTHQLHSPWSQVSLQTALIQRQQGSSQKPPTTVSAQFAASEAIIQQQSRFICYSCIRSFTSSTADFSGYRVRIICNSPSGVALDCQAC